MSYKYTVPPPVRIFIPNRWPSHIYSYRIGLQNFAQKDKEGKNLLYNPQKQNFSSGHFKGPKRLCFCFQTKLSPLDPYIMLTRVGNNGIKSIPEFRYGSLLYPPLKIFACLYTFLGFLVTFLQKTRFSKWHLFLKIGLGGLKSKK